MLCTVFHCVAHELQPEPRSGRSDINLQIGFARSFDQCARWTHLAGAIRQPAQGGLLREIGGDEGPAQPPLWSQKRHNWQIGVQFATGGRALDQRLRRHFRQEALQIRGLCRGYRIEQT